MKRKKMKTHQHDSGGVKSSTTLHDILPKVSFAIRLYMVNVSKHIGQDCHRHAIVAQATLSKLGIESKVVTGFAAWRVGNGDGDVIAHHPESYSSGSGASFHSWLEVGENILDFTTYQLRIKAAQLDALDGKKTKVLWCPDFLYVPKASTSAFAEVRDKKPGMYYYQRDILTEDWAKSLAPKLAEYDVTNIWMIYQNPNRNFFFFVP